MWRIKYEECPVSARGRVWARPRAFEGPDLPSPVIDALNESRHVWDICDEVDKMKVKRNKIVGRSEAFWLSASDFLKEKRSNFKLFNFKNLQKKLSSYLKNNEQI